MRRQSRVKVMLPKPVLQSQLLMHSQVEKLGEKKIDILSSLKIAMTTFALCLPRVLQLK
jgi:hypothetical protein